MYVMCVLFVWMCRNMYVCMYNECLSACMNTCTCMYCVCLGDAWVGICVCTSVYEYIYIYILCVHDCYCSDSDSLVRSELGNKRFELVFTVDLIHWRFKNWPMRWFRYPKHAAHHSEWVPFQMSTLVWSFLVGPKAHHSSFDDD